MYQLTDSRETLEFSDRKSVVTYLNEVANPTYALAVDSWMDSGEAELVLDNGTMSPKDVWTFVAE